MNNNYIYLDEEEYSESSLDQKIKKLQEKTFGKEKEKNLDDFNYYIDNNNNLNKKYNPISNSGSNNSIFNSNKNLKRNKLSQTKKSKSSSKLNYINTNKKNLKNNSIKKNNYNRSKLSQNQKQNTSIRSNGNSKNYLYSELDIKNNDFYYGNDYDIKKYKNEIIHLKNTINRLRTENEKLKKSLQKERRQNKKFRQLTEEIIKHYEKTK